MAYNFQKLLTDNSIVINDLSPDIQTAIKEFKNLEYDLEDEEDPDDIKEIKRQLKELDKNLCQLITEEIDKEIDSELSEEEVKENILENFITNGKVEVSSSELTRAGYNTKKLSSTGERLSNYALQKGKFSNNYKIIKHV
jgi:hypothetical protein